MCWPALCPALPRHGRVLYPAGPVLPNNSRKLLCILHMSAHRTRHDYIYSIWKLDLTSLVSLWVPFNLSSFLQPPALRPQSPNRSSVRLLTLPSLLDPSHPSHGFRCDLSSQSIFTALLQRFPLEF